MSKAKFGISMICISIVIGVIGDVSYRLRTGKRLGQIEAGLKEQQNKNAVRDAWMREHNSELMERIEERIK